MNLLQNKYIKDNYFQIMDPVKCEQFILYNYLFVNHFQFEDNDNDEIAVRTIMKFGADKWKPAVFKLNTINKHYNISAF